MCHRGTSFLHVDGRSYIVFGMSTGTGVILACRRAHFGMSTAAVTSFFGMSTGTHHFGMSTGAFCMSTGAFTILHFTIFSFQATFLHREPLF